MGAERITTGSDTGSDTTSKPVDAPSDVSTDAPSDADKPVDVDADAHTDANTDADKPVLAETDTNANDTSTRRDVGDASTIKLVAPKHDSHDDLLMLQQRGSSLRAGAGRSHPDSSTDSVDSFKSTKEIPREFAPDSPPSTSQISTPKKKASIMNMKMGSNNNSSSNVSNSAREPKDDPDQEDFSFVDHSDSVKKSTASLTTTTTTSAHKPWDKDDPRARRSILAEFENDLNDLLLLSNKSPDGEDMHDLEFDPDSVDGVGRGGSYSSYSDREDPFGGTGTNSGTTNAASASATTSRGTDTIIPVPPTSASSASTATTTTPITIPTSAEHESGTPSPHPVSVSPTTAVHTATTSPTSPTYMDAPPPPPADPMPSAPGGSLDNLNSNNSIPEPMMRGKRAPSVASSTNTINTVNTNSSVGPHSLNANKRGLRSVSSSASLKLRTSIFPFKGPGSAGVATTPETASMTGSMYSSSIYSTGGSTLVRDSPAVTMAKTRMRTSLKSFPILYYAVTLSGPVNVKYNIEGATPSGQYGILSLPTAPHPWEKPPEDLALRGVWFLRLVVDSGTNTAGGFLTDKLFVPRDVWSLSTSMSPKVLDKRLYITDEYCRAICEFMAFADAAPKGGAKGNGPQTSAQSIDDALERLDARIDNLSRHQYVVKSDGDLIIDLGANSPDSDDTLTPLASSIPSESTIHPVMSHPTPSTTPMTSNNRRSSDIGLLANHIFSKKEEKPKEPKEDKDNSSSKLFKRFQRKISLANNHSSENLSLPSDKGSNGGSKFDGSPAPPVDPHHDYGARYFNAISALYSDMEALAHYRFLLQNEARDSQAAKGYSQAVIIEAIDSCFAFSNTICRIILQDILAMLEVYLEGGKAVLSD